MITEDASEILRFIWVPVSGALFYFFKKRDKEIDMLAKKVSEHQGIINHHASKIKTLDESVGKMSETQTKVLSKISSIEAHLEHQTSSLNRLEDRFLSKQRDD